MARPEKEPKTELAKRLREVRRSLGDPERSEIAKTLGVSVSTLAFYERGESEPTASVLAIYRSAYDIDLDWLLTGNGKMHVGDDVQVGEYTLAHVRKMVWNIAETYWQELPRRTKPAEVADHFVETLDYLLSREQVNEDAASEVIQFGAQRLKRTSDQDAS